MSECRLWSFTLILACPHHVWLAGPLGNAGCLVLPVEGVGLDMISTAQTGAGLSQRLMEQFPYSVWAISELEGRCPISVMGFTSRDGVGYWWRFALCKINVIVG